MPQHTKCRVCGQPLPAPFFDLGSMPLANAFPSTPAEFATEPTYPLAVTACPECGLVQLDYVVPAETLYRDYIYVSSTSEGVRAHAESLADTLVTQYGWDSSDVVVEVASNDGTVLQAFKRLGIGVLGIEPARNIAAVARDAGVPTLAEFFDLESARTVLSEHGRASAILGRHVFAHVDDVHHFMEAVELLLADDGVFIIEVPYLGDLLEKLEFDTIYHEHLSYFSLEPIRRLCEIHGFELSDVDRTALHGGSIVLHMRRKGAGSPSERLCEMLAAERALALTAPAALAVFADRIRDWKGRFETMIGDLAASGATVAGYGAAAKANTLLNYCPGVARSLRCILDRSPHKHGRFTPGTHVPVVPVTPDAAAATHLVILAWNFQDEIMRQMSAFQAQGGRFVVPIPAPRIL